MRSQTLRPFSASLIVLTFAGGFGSCDRGPVADEVRIPSGPFLMGCNPTNDPDCTSDEGPMVQLEVPSFKIDRTEVTRAAYQQCVTSGGCTAPSGKDDPAATANLPVRHVTWFQARDYCAFRKKRLPTEVEWEKAARGVDGRRYAWGNDKPTCVTASFSSECGDAPHPVGTHHAGASPFGVEDMIGNVEEWVDDWYTTGWYSSRKPGSLAGPLKGAEKVVRGGAFNYDWWHSRVTHRFYQAPEISSEVLGFRCASDA